MLLVSWLGGCLNQDPSAHSVNHFWDPVQHKEGTGPCVITGPAQGVADDGCGAAANGSSYPGSGQLDSN